MDCQNFGLSGVLARSTGVKTDLRLSPKFVYSGYNSISIKSFIGVSGDTFDRYLIRMLEIGESLNIINTIINYFLNTTTSKMGSLFSQKLLNTSLCDDFSYSYSCMEDVINKFLR